MDAIENFTHLGQSWNMPTIIRVLKSWRETHKAGATDRKAAWRAFENGHLDPISREPGAALVPPLVWESNAMLSKIVECWAVVGHCVALLCPHFEPLCHVLQKRCPLIRDVNHHRGSLIQVKEIRPRKEKKQQSALLPLWPPSLVASRRWRAVKKLKSLSLARRPIDEMVGQLILCTAVLLLIDFWTSSLLGFQFILLSF